MVAFTLPPPPKIEMVGITKRFGPLVALDIYSMNGASGDVSCAARRQWRGEHAGKC